MIIIFVVLVIGGGLSGGSWIQFAPLTFASIYAIGLAPGAFNGGSELNESQLLAKLSEKWRNADQISKFITKYWYSIKYLYSAPQRGANCSFIGLALLVLAGWYFYIKMPIWAIVWCVGNGILLGVIGVKVNKAIFILMNEQDTPQWNLACVSFVALSEIFENKDFRSLVNDVLPRDKVEYAISLYAK